MEHIPASEMVKRVAEALCVASGMNANNWQHKQHLARAAIEAMMDQYPEAWLIPHACAVIGDGDRAAAFAADGHEVVPLYALSSSLKEQERT